MRLIALLAALLVAATAANAQQFVQGRYPVGAWFPMGADGAKDLERYGKARFNLIPYSKDTIAFAQQHDMQTINSVGASGRPAEASQLLEEADGSRKPSVGLFLHHNFNYPPFRSWWRETVPPRVRAMTEPQRAWVWKVENEFGYHSSGAYDYSPTTIEKYRVWLKDQYGDIATLNARWRSRHADFSAIQPPRERPVKDMANWLDWRRFTCWNFGEYFRTSGDLIRQALPGAKVSDNFYTTHPMQGWDVFDLARQTDYLAYDIYALGRWDELRAHLDLCRSAAAASSKPAILLEYHAGPNNWAPVITARDITTSSYMALARDYRGMVYFRWRPGSGGREEGIHGLTDTQGGPTERVMAAADFATQTQRLQPWLEKSRVVAPVAVLYSVDSMLYTWGKGTNSWGHHQAAQRVGAALRNAHVGFDLVDDHQIEEGCLSRYRALVVAECPILPAPVAQAMERFVQAGGTLLFLGDCAHADAWGHAYPEGRRPLNAQQARNAPKDRATATASGRGRILYAGGIEALAPLARELAGPLALDVPDPAVDAVLLSLGERGQAVILSLPKGDPKENLRVGFPAAADTPTTAYCLRPYTAAVERLPVHRAGDRATVTLPRLEEAAVILLPRAFQPLLSLSLPQRAAPGATVTGSVVVDNLGAQAVSGVVTLAGTGKARVSLAGDGRFGPVPPGGRAEVPVRVSLPADCPVDRFALDNGVTAKVSFQSGMTGVGETAHFLRVAPPLDVLLTQKGEILNPYQEMAPPLMRWGWERDVITPPPSPVAVHGDTRLELCITPAAPLARLVARLSIEGGEVKPSRLEMPLPGEARVPITVRLPRAGSYVLRVEPEGGLPPAQVPFRADVGPETLTAALAAPTTPPAGRRVIGRVACGSVGGPANGGVVSLTLPENWKLPESVRVLDAAGKPVPALLGGRQLSLAPDLPAGEARVFTVVEARPGEPEVGIAMTKGAAPLTLLQGPRYVAGFNTAGGVLETLALPGGEPLLTGRTGVVALSDADTVLAPTAKLPALGTEVTAARVYGEVEFTGAIEDGQGRQLSVRQSFRCLPDRLRVTVRVRSNALEPLGIKRLAYDLGLDTARWNRWRAAIGTANRSGGTARPVTATIQGGYGDILAESGSGLAVVPDKSVQVNGWMQVPLAVEIRDGRASLTLARSIRLSRGDEWLASFDLIPHAGALDAKTLALPDVLGAAAP